VAFATQGTAQLRQNYALALTLAGDRATAYKVAEFDLGPSRSLTQVDDWYINASKPLPEQLAAFTGLKSQSSGKPAQMAAAVLPPVGAAPAAVVAAAAPAEPLNILPEVSAPEVPVTQVPDVKTPDTKAVVISHTMIATPAKIVPIAFRPVRSKHVGFNSTAILSAPFKGWLVQLAAVNPNVNAQSLKTRLLKQFGRFLGRLGPVSHAQVTAGNRTLKRVFVGPYRTKSQAAAVCARVKTRGGSCLVRSAVSPAVAAPETKI
jgi:hypothetical protein